MIFGAGSPESVDLGTLGPPWTGETPPVVCLRQRSVQFSSVQFSSVQFGLDFIGHYFISSIIIFKVQFSSVQRLRSNGFQPRPLAVIRSRRLNSVAPLASPPGRHQEQASEQRCTFSLAPWPSSGAGV